MGSTRQIMFISVLFLFSQVNAKIPDYGRQWVKSHPFTIYSWWETETDDAYRHSEYRAINNSIHCRYWYTDTLTTAWPNLYWHVNLSVYPNHIAAIKSWILSNTNSDYSDAFYIRDEPDMSDPNLVNAIQDIVDFCNKERPDGLTYINTFRVDDLDDIKSLGVDALMVDMYPYMDVGVERIGLFSALYHLSSYGTQSYTSTSPYNGMPFFWWVQTFEGDWWRTPSESEVRMHVWSGLTAGASGIGYFFYEETPETSQTLTNALIDENGNQTCLYDYVEDISPIVESQGKYFRHLRSLGYWYVLMDGHALPTYVTQWDNSLDEDSMLDDIYIQTNLWDGDSANADILLGQFEDDAGNFYFMVTNLNRGPTKDKADATCNIVLDFSPGIDQIYRLNPATGDWDKWYTDANNSVNYAVYGGTGEVFCYSKPNLAAGIAGTIKIENDSKWCNNLYPQYNLWALDEDDNSNPPAYFQLKGESDYGYNGNWGTWFPYGNDNYRTSTGVFPGAITQGGRTRVLVRFKDSDGKISSLWYDDIYYDSISPTGSITINDGDDSTASVQVIINNNVVDAVSGVSEMRFSNDGGTSWSDWEDFNSNKDWVLTSSSGLKTVTVEFKDNAGNILSVNDAINLL
ncbi:MAG: hypothetical protein ACIAQZ_11720 [Sedimentisphaeraceae bacterium JB056]